MCGWRVRRSDLRTVGRVLILLLTTHHCILKYKVWPQRSYISVPFEFFKTTQYNTFSLKWYKWLSIFELKNRKSYRLKSWVSQSLTISLSIQVSLIVMLHLLESVSGNIGNEIVTAEDIEISARQLVVFVILLYYSALLGWDFDCFTILLASLGHRVPERILIVVCCEMTMSGAVIFFVSL